MQHWNVHCQGRQGVWAFSKDGQGISFYCTVLYCSSAFWCRVYDATSRASQDALYASEAYIRGLVAKQRILEQNSETKRKEAARSPQRRLRVRFRFSVMVYMSSCCIHRALWPRSTRICFLESTAPYSLPCLLRRRVLSTQSFLPREKKAMTTATLQYKSDHPSPHPTFHGWATYARTTTAGRISNCSMVDSMDRVTYSKAKFQWGCS